MKGILIGTKDSEFKTDDGNVVRGINVFALCEDMQLRSIFLTPERQQKVGFDPLQIGNLFDPDGEYEVVELNFVPGYNDKMKLDSIKSVA